MMHNFPLELVCEVFLSNVKDLYVSNNIGSYNDRTIKQRHLNRVKPLFSCAGGTLKRQRKRWQRN